MSSALFPPITDCGLLITNHVTERIKNENSDTFVATADVVEDMWVGLSIAQSDVDFWLDDFRFFEGEPADEIKALESAVSATDKLPTSWGSIKERY